MKNFKKPAKNLKEDIINSLDLPKEIILNKPLITILGNNELILENFKNILEYSEDRIKLKTSCGIFNIEGNNLYIKEMNKEKVFVNGKIHKLEFSL